MLYLAFLLEFLFPMQGWAFSRVKVILDQTVRETEKAAPLDTRGKEEAPSPMARKRTSPPQGRETPVGKLSIRYLKHECK